MRRQCQARWPQRGVSIRRNGKTIVDVMQTALLTFQNVTIIMTSQRTRADNHVALLAAGDYFHNSCNIKVWIIKRLLHEYVSY